MADDDWATLYVRLPGSLHKRIREEAETDERAIAKWVFMHFRDYFAELDAKKRETASCDNPSSNTSVL